MGIPDETQDALHDIRAEIEQLEDQIEGGRGDDPIRAEIELLRDEVAELRDDVEYRLEELDDEVQLLEERMRDQL